MYNKGGQATRVPLERGDLSPLYVAEVGGRVQSRQLAAGSHYALCRHR